MIQFVAGIVVGVFVAIAAMHPADAKRVANSTIDAVHNSYISGANATNGPIPAQAVDAATDTAKEVVKKVEK
jgi:hypothetical protein